LELLFGASNRAPREALQINDLVNSEGTPPSLQYQKSKPRQGPEANTPQAPTSIALAEKYGTMLLGSKLRTGGELMNLQEKLCRARKDSALSQQQVSSHLQVTREVVSQWELGSRRPGTQMLDRLAVLYNAPYLVRPEDESLDLSELEKCSLITQLGTTDASDTDSNKAAAEVGQWLEFLSRWAEFKKEYRDAKAERGKPPKALDRGAPIRDSRQAVREAIAVRDHFSLGKEAISNLYALMDEWCIMVYKANLGRWSPNSKEGISGAFYNHPELGFCVIVNAQTTPGRQTFTLAHELAHAMYHYAARTIVSRAGVKNPFEQFADSFASHFLIPTKSLNEVIDQRRWRQQLDPIKVVFLASCFQVSWLFLLNRLHHERHISIEQLREWSELSPRKLAESVGLDATLFTSQVKGIENDLHRFPPSVLSEVRDAILHNQLERYQAADLLGHSISGDELYETLCVPALADAEERNAISEFDMPYQLAGAL
jgi:Zn-dependent peptidase ImmA (M78 family)/DNA-binding transcriptional regulator YiaG